MPLKRGPRRMQLHSIALVVALLWAPAWADNDDIKSTGSSSRILFDTQGEVMMSLPNSVVNWNASAELAGFNGWNWPKSPPCSGGRNNRWTGVTCDNTRVIKIELPTMGLQGVLPPDLLLLPDLQVLNLSDNSFSGTLPPQWASKSLTTLDLSNNLLSGPLPVAYGSKETFFKLSSIYLQGNSFSGSLPGPEWTSIGFAPQATIVLRPGNQGLCGPVPIVDPRFYTTMPSGGSSGVELLGPTAVSSSGAIANTSQAYIVYLDLLADTEARIMYTRSLDDYTTNVVVTNTLGSCADPCGRTAMLKSNILEAAWENDISLADLLNYNPGLDQETAEPGTLLAIPCYPTNLEPTQIGSDAALGMFAGGNQKSMVGTIGAELAGAVVSNLGLNASTGFYEGIHDWQWNDDGTMVEVIVQPVYWFVQLEAKFVISALSITAGKAMNGISLHVGSDTSNALANTEVASNLNFASGETRIISAAYTKGDIVILYAGYAPEGTMSLADVKVWPTEGNAAARKPVFASSNSLDLNATTDGVPGTCAAVRSDSTDGLWFGVDLGYEVDVAVVVLTLEGGTPSTTGRLFVSKEDGMTEISNSTVCATLPEAPWASRIGVQCGIRGRFIGVQVDGEQELKVCEVEVFVMDAPAPIPVAKITISSSNVVGIAVGCAVGGAVLAIAIIAFFVYIRRRRLHKKVAAQAIAHRDRFADPETGLPISMHKGSFTSAGGSSKFFTRKWLAALNRSSGHSDSTLSSPTKLAASMDPITASTDLSKFTDGCDIVAFSDIQLVRTIGEGSYGLVWMARYLQTTVAVKVLTQDAKCGAGIDSSAAPPPSEAVLSALQREASIMAALRHPNVAQYLGACLNPPALVMEYCSKRSVDRILSEALLDCKTAKQLNWVHLLSMAADAAKGMLYLHTRTPPIVHRDLKSPNLLVDALWHVKVSDFNLSRALEQNSSVSSLQITNPRWLAPEVLKGGQAGVASDVYSFGIVLWELLTWKLPWGHDTNPFAIINKVVSGEELPVPAQEDLPAGPLQCYDSYVALMRRCWTPDAEKRPTMDEVVQALRGLLSEIVQTRIGQGSQSTVVHMDHSSASSSEALPSD